MQANAASVTELAEERSIVISRVFDAPREMVFDAWADPRQVVEWWGPTGFTMTIEEMEFREGGNWVHVMHGPDGTDYPHRSVYTKIKRPELIVHVNGGGKRGSQDVSSFVSTATFEEVAGGKTLLTLRMDFSSAEERDRVVREYGAVEGARQTLGRLADFLQRTATRKDGVTV